MAALDLRILAELQVDARVSFAELGRRVARTVTRPRLSSTLRPCHAAPCPSSETRARLPIALTGSPCPTTT
ncbi:AsnC family protein [Nonomuraea sp. NPDC049714]|uniref:AsnC family protein n=1 Tax=Nonomuraea sp. NPDC049714 TaxID=3364357 RepID=UPI00379552F9